MADINVDEIGPVDYLIVGFPAQQANFSGAMAAELKTLIDSNIVRVRDLVRLMKAHDGAVEASELRDADDSKIGETLDPRSAAAVLVWEHTWAAPVGLSRAHIRRRAARQRLDPDACARRRSRSGPRGRDRRSMTMGLVRDRCDRLSLLGRDHERRDDRREDRRDDRGDRRDDPQDRRTGPGPVAAIARGRVAMNTNDIVLSASAGPTTDCLNPRGESRPT